MSRAKDKGGHLNKAGYRVLRRHGQYILEHRYVMEQHLGRKLHPWENIHHRDGSRSNNAMANLELWVEKQPPGQRAEDLIPWMVDYLAVNANALDDATLGALMKMLSERGFDMRAPFIQFLERHGYTVTKHSATPVPPS